MDRSTYERLRHRSALTRRESEILDLVAEGGTNPVIAKALGISPRTVQTHLAHVFEKLGARTRAAAVARRPIRR